jgi:hypothetical protein
MVEPHVLLLTRSTYFKTSGKPLNKNRRYAVPVSLLGKTNDPQSLSQRLSRSLETHSNVILLYSQTLSPPMWTHIDW